MVVEPAQRAREEGDAEAEGAQGLSFRAPTPP